jgi:hypothetical protein
MGLGCKSATLAAAPASRLGHCAVKVLVHHYLRSCPCALYSIPTT